MTLALTLAADAQAIGECQYASYNQEIKFTAFTSCVGIGYLAGNGQVFGVHLPIALPDGSYFSVDDVTSVRQQLQAIGYRAGTGLLLGQITYWTNSVPEAYAVLVQQCGIAADRCYQFDDGIYGVELVDGALQPTYEACNTR